MKHLVMFSGGIGSWAAAKRVAEEHGTADLTLLFADTRQEHKDTYRFLGEAAANVGGTLIRTANGRNVWEVFFDVKFIGNSRVDPCSRILKRERCERHRDQHFDPTDTTVYVGIDWTEEHRLGPICARNAPWRYEAPLCRPPYLEKRDLFKRAEAEGLRISEMYRLGYPHDNCHGACVKAGQAQWALTLRTFPHVYAEWEENEERFRAESGKDVSILKDRRGGEAKPLTLRAFRERVQAGGQCDLFEWGGCGCGV